MGGDPLTQQGDGDGAGRKQVWLWAGGTPESESNPDVDGLRNIGIDSCPGFRVNPRERPGHEASSSRLVPESGSNQESDQAAPIRYEIGLARRERGSGRWARRRPQHQAQRCRDREFLRLPSSTLHETRRVPVGNPQGPEQIKSRLGAPLAPAGPRATGPLRARRPSTWREWSASAWKTAPPGAGPWTSRGTPGMCPTWREAWFGQPPIQPPRRPPTPRHPPQEGVNGSGRTPPAVPRSIPTHSP